MPHSFGLTKEQFTKQVDMMARRGQTWERTGREGVAERDSVTNGGVRRVACHSLMWIAVVVLLAGLVHAQAQSPPPAKNPHEGDPQAIRLGTARFQLVCAECHGMDAKGVFGPDLTTLWASGLTDDEVWAILAYLRTLTTTAPPPPVSGDAVNGERVFRANCVACHRVNGRGGYLGPDLSRIGSSRSRDTLIRKIRDASASIVPGYKPVTLVTTDGRRVRGVNKGDDAFSIRIMDTREQLQGYLKSGLREVIEEPRSLMPDFDAERLGERDLDDLLRYLSTLRGASPARP
jgi:cytochrome c oxidase cbb3-type subunit III